VFTIVKYDGISIYRHVQSAKDKISVFVFQKPFFRHI